MRVTLTPVVLLLAAGPVLAAPIDPLPDVTKMTNAELLEAGRTAKQTKDLNRAAFLFSTCLDRSPNDLDCIMGMAGTVALRGNAFDRQSDRELARTLYERFLVLAPLDDPRVPRVRASLEMPPAPAIPGSAPVVMPPKVALKKKETRSIAVSTIVRLTNDDPAVVDATLVDRSTLKLTGLKPGVANLQLYDPDGSWHAMRVTVK
ncbi:MAG: pilus assembly protein N-terminal domain-containing protein [Myxococcaceae bacterium]|nr:pilus assembly protein N-terminal domain-containing protein [Myxococcaceae bacterium]